MMRRESLWLKWSCYVQMETKRDAQTFLFADDHNDSRCVSKKEENFIFTIFVMTSRLKPASDLLVCLYCWRRKHICCIISFVVQKRTWESSSLHEIRWWWKDEDNRKLWSHSRAFPSFLLLHHRKLAWGWRRMILLSNDEIIILLSCHCFFLYKKWERILLSSLLRSLKPQSLYHHQQRISF